MMNWGIFFHFACFAYYFCASDTDDDYHRAIILSLSFFHRSIASWVECWYDSKRAQPQNSLKNKDASLAQEQFIMET